MAEHADNVQVHPANAVFALMEDRQFRFSVVRPALEEDKAGLCRLTTGKHQLRGFRNISRGPISLLLPVISDEANLSAELAERILRHWLGRQSELREKIGARLKELGYEAQEDPFDEDGAVHWKGLRKEHADQQFDGKFLPDEDPNAVMLMSLLLGWFGEEEKEEPDAPQAQEAQRSSPQADEGGEQEREQDTSSSRAGHRSPPKTEKATVSKDGEAGGRKQEAGSGTAKKASGEAKKASGTAKKASGTAKKKADTAKKKGSGGKKKNESTE